VHLHRLGLGLQADKPPRPTSWDCNIDDEVNNINTEQLHAVRCAPTKMRYTVSVVVCPNATYMQSFLCTVVFICLCQTVTRCEANFRKKTLQDRKKHRPRNEIMFNRSGRQCKFVPYAYFICCETYCNFVHPTDRSSL